MTAEVKLALELASYVPEERHWRREDPRLPKAGWSSWAGEADVKHEDVDSFRTRHERTIGHRLRASFRVADLTRATSGTDAATSDADDATDAVDADERDSVGWSSDCWSPVRRAAAVPGSGASVPRRSAMLPERARGALEEGKVDEFADARTARTASLLKARQLAAREALARRRALQRSHEASRERARADEAESQRVHARARRALRETLEIERLVERATLIGDAERARERAAAAAEATRIFFRQLPPPPRARVHLSLIHI